MTHLNQYEEALASFEQSLKLNPDDFIAWVWKAGAYTHLDEYSKALAALNEALKRCPIVVEEDSEYDRQAIILFRGVVLQELGRHQEAYECYHQALEIEKEERESLWQQFSRAFERCITRPFKGRKRDLALPQRIGERLQVAGLLAAEQVGQILAYQRQHHYLSFGEIAIRWGWLKPETIDFFVEQLPDVFRQQPKKPLGQYLKAAALLDDFQICTILELQQEWEGWRFGQIAVRQGWVTQKTINFFLEQLN